MIDLHCHIIPGIDDGPATIEDSLSLARAAFLAGTRKIVATSHVSWDWPDNDSRVIAAGVAKVNAALREHEIGVEVVAGAEIAMTRVGDLTDGELDALRLGGGPYLLIESPYSPSAAGFDTILHQLRTRGHKIVLAHPERCPAFHSRRDQLERFVSEGVLTSVTAGSLVGRFGKDVQKFSERLIADGLCHNIASDAHSSQQRPPGIAPELEAAGLGEQSDWFARAVPQAILDGTRLPPPPQMPATAKRSLISRLRG